ncbi:AraC family transcriptional regulator [Chitinophaga sp. CF418]|uniref:helix-turn-helix domain-containing protein n=1 Tax=Chitinophaga sp. CF418 TaxID=1855287 RepID=UPI00091E00CC|nr:helix-turn-helix domain-containing protein [Chitinophaga sp. CF418]SHN43256.1 AraC-type DNA-binding protein [Chitinophaga sp. CF418]
MNATTYVLPDASLHVKAERNSYFEIHTLEEMKRKGLCLNEQPERLQHFEIIWFKTGKGQITIDTVQHSVGHNMIYCLTPGQVRICRLPGAAEGYYISFSQDFIYRWATYTINSAWLDTNIYGMSIPAIKADDEMKDEMEDLMEKMEKEYTHHYLLRSEILAGLLNILVIYITRKLQLRVYEQAQSKEIELVQKFIALVKVHFRTMKFVADYAGELFVTANHLNRIVKKITGTPASSHIQQHIIMEAKRQALHSNVSMKEIAYLLGFEDHSHFSKYFKNNSGMNFSSFKKGLITDLVAAAHD